MSKRDRDGTAKDNAFLTVRFEECALIIQCHPTLPNPNRSLKLREKDGTLWEAFYTNEERHYLYDDMDQLSDEVLATLIQHTRHTIESLKAECHPSKARTFELQITTRKEALVCSALLDRDVRRAIAEGAVVPELIALHRHSSDRMAADFFVKHKYVNSEDNVRTTLCDSIRLTFQRVPEFFE
jgi:hypothetical protein